MMSVVITYALESLGFFKWVSFCKSHLPNISLFSAFSMHWSTSAERVNKSGRIRILWSKCVHANYNKKYMYSRFLLRLLHSILVLTSQLLLHAPLRLLQCFTSNVLRTNDFGAQGPHVHANGVLIGWSAMLG